MKVKNIKLKDKKEMIITLIYIIKLKNQNKLKLSKYMEIKNQKENLQYKGIKWIIK